MKLPFGWELVRNRQKSGQKVGGYHKVCKNGHNKPYRGECEVCLDKWREARKAKRWAKRQIANAK
jgi:hypothetical protein